MKSPQRNTSPFYMPISSLTRFNYPKPLQERILPISPLKISTATGLSYMVHLQQHYWHLRPNEEPVPAGTTSLTNTLTYPPSLMIPISNPLSAQLPINPKLRTYEIAIQSHQRQQHFSQYTLPAPFLTNNKSTPTFMGQLARLKFNSQPGGRPSGSGAPGVESDAKHRLLHLTING